MTIKTAEKDLYNIEDFTLSHYEELLEQAHNYEFASYADIDFSKKFILWRHDCDFSLNRALKLAQIEHAAGIQSTFFLNPHCEFYNLLEKKQTRIIRDIIDLGHEIALHLDIDFYDMKSEDELDAIVKKEAAWLSKWFETDIYAFSFHNPDAFALSCEKERYGELINCYSAQFKEIVGYCSDSNGYWRFRRLYDVLKEAQDKHLQILTHPVWWQDEPMLPRDRIKRSVQGRADAALKYYDDLLASLGRQNVG